MEFDKIISKFLSSGNEKLDSLLKFTTECDAMTHILRMTVLTDNSRRENDAEHSWHIALMALLFKEFFPEDVNVDRAVKMCVCHDLIEIYAGDTFAYDTAGNETKTAREKAAADRLFGHLPHPLGKEIRSLWEEFDAMQTADSRYANCMDRIQPFLHNTLTEGHTWVQGRVSKTATEKRMKPVKDFMPAVWPWIEKNIERGIKEGWLTE